MTTATRKTAYGRPAGSFDPDLVQTGPGTPGGEFLRRYWHPVALSSELGARPRKVGVLGEELVLFRDGSGRPGLITPRCVHRGAPMDFGKVEARGIRCAYHGWLFSAQGECLDQPCEPDGGRLRNRIQQPWYPVQERYGLVFAYLGPPQRMPALPHWAAFEDLGPGEKIVADDSAYTVGADDSVSEIPWAWMQDWENTMDPHHVSILHTAFSGSQFAPEMAVTPQITWEYTAIGMRYLSTRVLDGRQVQRVTHVVLPNIRSVPNIDLSPGTATSMGWLVPIDDRRHRAFHITRVAADFEGVPLVTAPVWPGGKKWSQMTPQEHWITPGDWEIQSGLGEDGITLHSEERLATSDRGVVMLRRLLKQQIQAVREGRDPAGVSFDAAAAPVEIGAGNFYADGVAASRADAAAPK